MSATSPLGLRRERLIDDDDAYAAHLRQAAANSAKSALQGVVRRRRRAGRRARCGCRGRRRRHVLAQAQDARPALERSAHVLHSTPKRGAARRRRRGNAVPLLDGQPTIRLHWDSDSCTSVGRAAPAAVARDGRLRELRRRPWCFRRRRYPRPRGARRRDGVRLHPVPEQAPRLRRPAAPRRLALAAPAATPSWRRVSLLVSLWVGHRPEDAARLPAECGRATRPCPARRSRNWSDARRRRHAPPGGGGDVVESPRWLHASASCVRGDAGLATSAWAFLFPADQRARCRRRPTPPAPSLVPSDRCGCCLRRRRSSGRRPLRARSGRQPNSPLLRSPAARREWLLPAHWRRATARAARAMTAAAATSPRAWIGGERVAVPRVQWTRGERATHARGGAGRQPRRRRCGWLHRAPFAASLGLVRLATGCSRAVRPRRDDARRLRHWHERARRAHGAAPCRRRRRRISRRGLDGGADARAQDWQGATPCSRYGATASASPPR